MRGRTWAVTILAILGLAACSSDSTEVQAGTELAQEAPNGVDQPVLEAVLEPTNALMSDPGEGWDEVDRWFTEGAMTHWGSGCSAFDQLGDIFNSGTPVTVVWAKGDDHLFQRTDDFGWDANDFARTVDSVPADCPSVEIGATTVNVTAVDTATLGPAADQITQGDPTGRLVAIAFDAYPHPSLETDISTPEFEPGRSAWMVVATRHNVVSQMVYGPGGDSGAEGLAELVSAQVDALLATPIEAEGPFEPAPPPPSVEPGTITDVELFVDPQTCANDGHIEHDGIRWGLVDAVPRSWQGIVPIRGDLEVDGVDGVFSAYPGPPPVPGEEPALNDEEVAPLEGFSVRVTTGPIPSECLTWEDPADDVPTDSSTIGRLDCDDRGYDELVIPDTGQTPEELAAQADPQTVSVESDGPLQWSGLNGGGRVIVALFLGDADDANWQIFTCASP